MTPTRCVLYGALAATMSVASLCQAGVWGAQPVLGIMADYYTNPSLIDIPKAAETHADLLIDAPTSYVDDAYKLSIAPSFRFSNSQGYSNLDSNYQHLTVSNEFDTPRGSVIFTGALARDSSLYHDFLLNGGTGVQRDSLLADLNWDRRLTERLDLDIDTNWSRAHYGQGSGAITLTDYKYESINPTLSWGQSELTKLTVNGGVARYNSLDGMTQSISENLQLGYSRQLSQLWTLSAVAGYSRAQNRDNFSEQVLELTPDGLVIVAMPVSIKTTQSGSVYNIMLTRQSSQLTVAASISRSLAPTGFAFLARQDVYQVKATYLATERWTLGGEVHRLNYSLPQGPTANQNIFNLTLTAAWQWTEHWTATLMATRVTQNYAASGISLASSGVSIELSRQFDWKRFR